jgi:peroxiredoxin
MALKTGDKIPSVTLKQATAEGPKDVTTADLFGGKKVVLFALPGAFTPTCSAKHLPGFVEKAAEIKGKGVDSIVCLSVNDAFVMGAWAKDQKVGDKVKMVADGGAEFTKAMGLDFDASKFGMGVRSQRYAAIVEDGVIRKLAVEEPMKFEVSSAEAVLKAL